MEAFVNAWVSAYGLYALFLLMLTNGFASMPQLLFLLFSVMGMAVWAVFWQGLGYAMSEAWQETS
jgi:membrane protein DedA with SNARE-associated domain